ncbi:MAG TPA: AI-2E family transporter [Thermoanaerobaculia bacterium]|nr:AI-2E family transporter [Thermoanaerobaculia bacterium]
MQKQRLSRYFFVFVLIATTALFFYMVRDFLVPVLLATVFCTLFYPLFERLARRLGGRRSLAAFLCCLVLLCGLVAPFYWVAALVVDEAVQFYNSAEAQVRALLERGDAGPLGAIQRTAWFRELRLDRFDWKAGIQDAATTAGAALATVVRATSTGTIQVVLVLFMTLFTMFYFFRDGDRLMARLKYLIPLPEAHEDSIISRFASVARATVRGTLVIALVQGSLAGLILWMFGIRSPILWAVVATVLSVVPLIGAWVVLLPAAVYLLAIGQVWQGIAMLALTIVVVGNIDNVIRPRLVGKEAGMHDLMVFFSTLGGIAVFGAMGFIVGPVIASLFLAVLEIYVLEFKDELDGLNGDGEAGPPPAVSAPALAVTAPAATTER